MDSIVTKYMLAFGTVITACAIIFAASSIVSMTNETRDSNTISEWEEVANSLNQTGGSIYCVADSGSTTTNRIWIGETATVTNVNGFLKITNGTSITEVPYGNITYVTYTKA